MSQYRQSGKDGPAKAAIVEYVGRSTSEGHGFVGPAYLARSATVEDLKVLEPEPFSACSVQPTRLALYPLGNNANARRRLHSWSR